MTEAGVKEYRRKNPGSKLKTAVTGKVKKGSKDAKRRKSFCARSAGQMKKFPKAAKDPNSRLKTGKKALEMLERPLLIIGLSTSLGLIGAVSYAWASWTTETLISVDKRTEVMATQIEYIKLEMEKAYGNVQAFKE